MKKKLLDIYFANSGEYFEILMSWSCYFCSNQELKVYAESKTYKVYDIHVTIKKKVKKWYKHEAITEPSEIILNIWGRINICRQSGEETNMNCNKKLSVTKIYSS